MRRRLVADFGEPRGRGMLRDGGGRLAAAHRGTFGSRQAVTSLAPFGHFGLVVAIYSGPACGRHVTFAMHNCVPGARSSAG